MSNTRIIKTNLKTTLTEHPHTSLATTMMVSERNQVGLLYSTASRLIKNGKMQRIIIGLVSMGLILRSFDVMFLVDSSSHAALDRLVDDVGDSNRGTTSNLNKEDAATDLINAADTARRSNGAWISGGATHTATAQCLSLNFEEKMDAVISNSTQVFITMPAKAAGTSLKRFTEKCMKQQEMSDNFINRPDLSKNFLTDSFELPSIITSHLYTGDQPLVDLAQHGTRQTLIIHVHRDETERLLSGIRQVLTSRVCEKKRRKDVEEFNISRNETHCILNEGPVVKLIENRVDEIGFGSPEILTCKAYEAIEQNAPNMIVLHYKQANKLQKLLAKHHCPELLEEPPIEANVAKEKRLTVYLRLQKRGGLL